MFFPDWLLNFLKFFFDNLVLFIGVGFVLVAVFAVFAIRSSYLEGKKAKND